MDSNNNILERIFATLLEEVISISNSENDERPDFGNIANVLGEELKAEYCSVGYVINDKLVDGKQWLRVPEGQEYRRKTLESNVKVGDLVGSMINDALTSEERYLLENEPMVKKRIATGRINLDNVKIYKEALCTSDEYHLMVCGIYSKKDDSGEEKPIGYIHFINKLAKTVFPYEIDKDGFTQKDLSIVLIVAKQIGLALDNYEKKNLLRLKENEIRKQNEDERFFNVLMSKSSNNIYHEFLLFLIREFDLTMASFWFPFWNGFEQINGLVHEVKEIFKPNPFNKLKILKREVLLNDKISDTVQRNELREKMMLGTAKDANDPNFIIGRLLLNQFQSFENWETESLPISYGKLSKENYVWDTNVKEFLKSDSYIAIPLYRGFAREATNEKSNKCEHIIGIIYMEKKDSNNNILNTQSLERLKTISSSLSILLEKILYKDRYDLIEILQKSLINLRIGDYDKNKSLNSTIVRTVKEVMKCRVCSMFFLDETENFLQLQATTSSKIKTSIFIDNEKSLYHKVVDSDLLINKNSYSTDKNSKIKSLTVNVYNSKATCINFEESSIINFSDHIFLESINEAENKFSDSFEHSSFLAVPIFGIDQNDKKERKVIGVIRCINKNKNDVIFQAFTQSDREFLLLITGFFSGFIQYEKWNKIKSRVTSILAHEFAHQVQGMMGTLWEGRRTITSLADSNIKEKLEKNCFEVQDSIIKLMTNHVDSFKESFNSLNLNDYTYGLNINKKKYNSNSSIKLIVTSMKIEANNDKKIDIQLFISQMPFLIVDKNKFDQVIYNLLKNAIKYSNSNKDIKIVYDRVQKKLGDYTTLFWDRISIENYGIEVKKEDISNIFKRGFRSEEAKKINEHGEGIGLHLVKEIMVAHGGDIIVENLNAPTIFSIYFPAN